MVHPVTGPLDENGDPICGFAAVGELTYNQPTDRLNIAGKNILARGIDIGDEGFVGAISGLLQDFTVGTPIETPDGSTAFDLDPVDANGDTITDPADLAAVCIVPSTGE